AFEERPVQAIDHIEWSGTQILFSQSTARLVLVTLHIHAASAKADALELQPQSLLEALLPRQADGPSRAYDAMPRQSLECIHGPPPLPRRARKAGRRRHLAVSRDLAFRYLANGLGEVAQVRHEVRQKT